MDVGGTVSGNILGDDELSSLILKNPSVLKLEQDLPVSCILRLNASA